MNYLTLGSNLDRDDQVVQAAWAYEVALHQSDTSMDVILDLVAIYLTSLDAGYAMAEDLNVLFTEAAYSRALEVLDLGRERFGSHPEFDAWELALRQLVLGEEIPREQFERLAREGSELATVEAALGDDEHFQAAANHLFDRVLDGATARKRYLRSFDHRRRA
jgi:hypothetical protein